MKLKLPVTLLLGASLSYALTPPLDYTTYANKIDYLTTSYFNQNDWSHCVGSTLNIGGCGGEFTGTIQNINNPLVTPPTTPTTALNFWCVDSQEDFSFGQSGYADIQSLDNFSPSLVRYSNVQNPGTLNANPLALWSNTTIGTGVNLTNLASSAQTRYEMTAWLVSQYDNGATPTAAPFNAGDPTILATDSQDEEIQAAIWYIMSNNSAAEKPYSNISSTDGNVTTDSVAGWIHQASSAITGPDFLASDWAVLSWTSDPASGTLIGNQQTFIVELGGSPTTHTLTPEPGFYGVMMLGLGGLVATARRRKLKA